MEILEIEQKYSELKSALSELNSKRNKLLLLVDYFSNILPNGNANILEAYIIEFMPDYLSYIEFLEIRGLNPEVLSKLQSKLKILVELNFANVSKDDVSRSSIALDEKLKLMDKWLNNGQPNQSDSKIYFPVLEKKESGFGNGYLESLNVQIKNGEQKFYITHSEYEGDEQLEKQITLCFSTAINYCKNFIRKIKPTHTIYLHFENKLGMYSGNSLGIALTLIFIEAILKHYNSTIALNINRRIALTGGIDNNSNIISTSKAIIEIKVETVFFSDVQIFCVPKIDELWAEEKLAELKKQHPNRNLKIIGLTDLEDLLSRRNVVDIRKQKLIVRTGKFVKKNWVSAVATVLLAVLSSYLFVMDFDDNPATVISDGQMLYIKNKNGKLLWTKHLLNKDLVGNEDYLSKFCKIIDVNSDGINEVLVANEQIGNNDELNTSIYLRCYNNNQELLWRFKFNEKVTTQREELSPIYSLYMIDTLSVDNSKKIFVFANNGPSFSSAIFSIDPMTGEKNPGTLWCSGHTSDGIIRDINGDGRKDIFCIGLDNGFENVVYFGIEIDTVNKVRLSITDYLINDFPTSELITYIRIPKTDYDIYKQYRFPFMRIGGFEYLKDEKKYYFVITSGDSSPVTGIWYKLDENLKDFDITIDNQYRIIRDTLVAQGKLTLPYTDTEEYKNIIKSNILYWKNGKWVKRNELD